MRGLVTNITDNGSIVTMAVQEQNGAERLVHFDHRMFAHLVEAEGGRPSGLLHREVEVRVWNGEQHVEFDPDPEWADAEVDQVAPT